MFDDAAAGGDEVLDDHDLLALFQLALDLVAAAVILGAGAHVAHGQAAGCGRRWRRGRCRRWRCPSALRSPGSCLLDGLGEAVFHVQAHLRAR